MKLGLLTTFLPSYPSTLSAQEQEHSADLLVSSKQQWDSWLRQMALVGYYWSLSALRECVKVGYRFNIKAKFTSCKLCKKTEELGWSVREKLTCQRKALTRENTPSMDNWKNYGIQVLNVKMTRGGRDLKRQDQSTKEKQREEIVKSRRKLCPTCKINDGN